MGGNLILMLFLALLPSPALLPSLAFLPFLPPLALEVREIGVLAPRGDTEKEQLEAQSLGAWSHGAKE